MFDAQDWQTPEPNAFGRLLTTNKRVVKALEAQDFETEPMGTRSKRRENGPATVDRATDEPMTGFGVGGVE